MGAELARATQRYVTLYGVQVTNEMLYQRYREEMTPILHGHRGSFGYDFTISKVLKSEVAHAINRVFTMVFVDRESYDLFFADPSYLKVRDTWFNQAVASVTKIGSYAEPTNPQHTP